MSYLKIAIFIHQMHACSLCSSVLNYSEVPSLLNDSCHLFAGQQTPELPDLRAGPGRLCSADSKPEEHFTWGSKQPCHRCRRVLWRDALCLVQDEIPACSCRVRDYCSCVELKVTFI